MSASAKAENLTVRYSFVLFFFWMSFASVMGFSGIYLLDVGFTNTQIGFVIAIAGVISAVLQPVVASYADKPSSPSLKVILLFTGSIMVILGALLLLVYKRSFLLTGLFFGASCTFLQLMTPLTNSLGTETMNQGKNVNFGVSRGMGSIAYGIAAYILGIIVNKTGVLAVPAGILLIAAFFVASMIVFPFQKERKGIISSEADSSGGLSYFLKRYPRFCIVLGGCVLLYAGHTLLNSFTFQIVESKGGTSANMGFAMALASVIEIPTMFLFGYMIKKLRVDIWFRICGIFFTLKVLGTLLAPSMLVFYGVQIFQLLGWALISVSSVYYVNAIMEPQDTIKGQAYMTMTYTLGSVLGSLIGGRLLDRVGVNTTLIFGTVASAIGMVILLTASERTQEKG